jgi:hypothetical protein
MEVQQGLELVRMVLLVQGTQSLHMFHVLLQYHHIVRVFLACHVDA